MYIFTHKSCFTDAQPVSCVFYLRPLTTGFTVPPLGSMIFRNAVYGLFLSTVLYRQLLEIICLFFLFQIEIVLQFYF